MQRGVNDPIRPLEHSSRPEGRDLCAATNGGYLMKMKKGEDVLESTVDRGILLEILKMASIDIKDRTDVNYPVVEISGEQRSSGVECMIHVFRQSGEIWVRDNSTVVGNFPLCSPDCFEKAAKFIKELDICEPHARLY